MAKSIFTYLSVLPISIILIVILSVGVILFWDSGEKIKSDKNLIKIFNENKNDFIELKNIILNDATQSNSLKKALMDKLDIKEIKVDTLSSSKKVFFISSTNGFVSSGKMKGYLFSIDEPISIISDTESFKNNSIDHNEIPSSYVYRKIDNSWFVFFYSN